MTYDNSRIIVVDNASTDSSVKKEKWLKGV